MAKSILLLFQKVFLKNSVKSESQYNPTLKLLLVQLVSFLCMASALAQSGNIQFSQGNYNTSEALGTVTLELERVGGSVGALTIDIQTQDGTATIVDDYAGIPTPLTLTWSNGNTTSKTVTLPIKTDALLEGNESFTMSITSTNPDWVGTPAIATVTIADTPDRAPSNSLKATTIQVRP